MLLYINTTIDLCSVFKKSIYHKNRRGIQNIWSIHHTKKIILKNKSKQNDHRVRRVRHSFSPKSHETVSKPRPPDTPKQTKKAASFTPKQTTIPRATKAYRHRHSGGKVARAPGAVSCRKRISIDKGAVAVKECARGTNTAMLNAFQLFTKVWELLYYPYQDFNIPHGCTCFIVRCGVEARSGNGEVPLWELSTSILDLVTFLLFGCVEFSLWKEGLDFQLFYSFFLYLIVDSIVKLKWSENRLDTFWYWEIEINIFIFIIMYN